MKHWTVVAVATPLVGLGVGLMLMGFDHERQPRSDISPDLSFIIDCKRWANPPSEDSIETFMSYNGFRMLDTARLAKEQPADPRRMKLDIIGIDSAHRKLEFSTNPTKYGSYFVDLYSEPPTQHSTILEDSLRAFTERTLRCPDREVEQSENPAEAKDLYDRSFSQIEDRFKQAAEMHGS